MWRDAQHTCYLKEASEYSSSCGGRDGGYISGRKCGDDGRCSLKCKDLDECMATTGLMEDCDAKVDYDFECSNSLGSYTCDRLPDDIVPPTDENGDPTDGCTLFVDSDSKTDVTVSTDELGNLLIDGIPAQISGTEVIVPNLADPTSPLKGTISDDGKMITFEDGTGIEREDLDECAAEPNLCPDENTECVNTVGAWCCNCIIDSNSPTETTRTSIQVALDWIDSIGEPVTLDVSGVDITISYSDGFIETATMCGSTISMTIPNADGSERTAEVNKSDECDKIVFDDLEWTRDYDECQLAELNGCDQLSDPHFCVNSPCSFSCTPDIIDILDEVPTGVNWIDENENLMSINVDTSANPLVVTVFDTDGNIIGTGEAVGTDITINMGDGRTLTGSIAADGDSITWDDSNLWIRTELTTTPDDGSDDDESETDGGTDGGNDDDTDGGTDGGDDDGTDGETDSGTDGDDDGGDDDGTDGETDDDTDGGTDGGTDDSGDDDEDTDGGTDGDTNGSDDGGTDDGTDDGSDDGTDGGTDGGSGDSTGGGVDGDPHFHVSYTDKPDLCFDYTAGNGTVFDIIRDWHDGLSVQGIIIESGYRSHFAYRLDVVMFTTPLGVEVNVFNNKVVIKESSGSTARQINLDTAYTVTVGDAELTVYSRQRMKHRGVSLKIGESTFSVTVKSEKKSMKFSIEKWHHSTNTIDGLLGFVMSKSYEVVVCG